MNFIIFIVGAWWVLGILGTALLAMEDRCFRFKGEITLGHLLGVLAFTLLGGGIVFLMGVMIGTSLIVEKVQNYIEPRWKKIMGIVIWRRKIKEEAK